MLTSFSERPIYDKMYQIRIPLYIQPSIFIHSATTESSSMFNAAHIIMFHLLGMLDAVYCSITCRFKNITVYVWNEQLFLYIVRFYSCPFLSLFEMMLRIWEWNYDHFYFFSWFFLHPLSLWFRRYSFSFNPSPWVDFHFYTLSSFGPSLQLAFTTKRNNIFFYLIAVDPQHIMCTPNVMLSMPFIVHWIQLYMHIHIIIFFSSFIPFSLVFLVMDDGICMYC